MVSMSSGRQIKWWMDQVVGRSGGGWVKWWAGPVVSEASHA